MSANREVAYSAEQWELGTPFRITGRTFHRVDVLYVSITENGVEGRGEAAGVYYTGETIDTMLADAESAKSALAAGLSRQDLQALLPAGGARNAIDCALWDLEAKQSRRSIWDLTNVSPKKTQSFFTIGIDTPDKMAAQALKLDSSKLKVKLDGEHPLECISAVRAARPDAEIIVDVNQGWSFAQLYELAPLFKSLKISMIEQPLPRGKDEELEGYVSPVPLGADESCLTTEEFPQAARRYQVINIKLDKTGGLTEALKLARMARSAGKDLMIGNMVGTSLGMAPGYVIAQLCKYVDLDGTLYLNGDRPHPILFEHGFMSQPESALWG